MPNCSHDQSRLSLYEHCLSFVLNAIDFNFRKLGQAKVQHLDVAIWPDHDVFRLYVAVHNSSLMSCGESGSYLSGYLQRFFQIDLSGKESLSKSDAFDELSCYERHCLSCFD